MLIIKKVIEKTKADELEKILLSDNFPWYWNESTLIGKESSLNSFMFTHNFVVDGKVNSDYFYLLEPIFVAVEKHAKIKSVLRIKANLLIKQELTEKELEDEIHTDIDSSDYISFVYYVTDSDGDTVLFDNDETITVSPQKNTGVLFTSNMKHRATSPMLHKRRVVLNFVFKI